MDLLRFRKKRFEQEGLVETPKRQTIYVMLQYYDDFNKTSKCVFSANDVRSLMPKMLDFVKGYYDGTYSSKIFLCGILRVAVRNGKFSLPPYESLPFFSDVFGGVYVAPHGLSLYGESNDIGGMILETCPLIQQIQTQQEYLGRMNRSELTTYIHQKCPFIDLRKYKYASKRTIVAKIMKVEIRSMIMDVKYAQID